MEEIYSFFRNWRKSVFAGVVSVKIVIGWFLISDYLFKENFDRTALENSYVLFIVGIFLICWFVARNKHRIKKTHQLRFGISFSVDEEEHLPDVRNIVKPIIEDLKCLPTLVPFKFFEFEENKFANKTAVQKYLKRRTLFDTPLILWLKVQKGKENGALTFKITEAIFFWKDIYSAVILNGQLISIHRELSIVSLDKRWSYLDENALSEKQELKDGLKEIMLYYAGIVLLCTNKLKESVDVLKELYNPEKLIVKGKVDLSKLKVDLNLKAENLLAARLANLIDNLYRSLALRKHQAESLNEAIEVLTEAVNVLGDTLASYNVLTTLARYSYENGELQNAKNYTNKMQMVANRETQEVLLNNGFFAMIEGETSKLLAYYKKLNNKYPTNGVDIVGFLNDHRKEEHAPLFDYAAAVNTKYFIDRKRGNLLLSRFCFIYKDNESCRMLREHARSILKS